MNVHKLKFLIKW